MRQLLQVIEELRVSPLLAELVARDGPASPIFLRLLFPFRLLLHHLHEVTPEVVDVPSVAP